MDDKRPSILPYFIAFGLLFLAFVLFVIIPVHGQGERYLVLRRTFVFERGSELPYEAIRPMNYDDVLGYTDIPIVNAYRAYVIVDLDTGLYAEVMASESGCFVLWLLPEIGFDNQPHVDFGEWIVCEDGSS